MLFSDKRNLIFSDFNTSFVNAQLSINEDKKLIFVSVKSMVNQGKDNAR